MEPAVLRQLKEPWKAPLFRGTCYSEYERKHENSKTSLAGESPDEARWRQLTWVTSEHPEGSLGGETAYSKGCTEESKIWASAGDNCLRRVFTHMKSSPMCFNILLLLADEIGCVSTTGVQKHKRWVQTKQPRSKTHPFFYCRFWQSRSCALCIHVSGLTVVKEYYEDFLKDCVILSGKTGLNAEKLSICSHLLVACIGKKLDICAVSTRVFTKSIP